MNNCKRLFVLAGIGILLTNYSFAQKQVNEASINYKITIESANDKPGLSKSLEGASLTLYLKGSQSRTDMVNALGMESTLYDSRLSKGTIMKEYSGQKLMITLTNDNWMQKNQLFRNMKFSFDNSEQKISGFTCKKATAVLPDGKAFSIYYSTEIRPANTSYNNAFGQLPGLPVQYEIESGKMKFKYVLNDINYDPVPSAKFEIPKSGYRVMSYDENQQLKKEGN